MCIRAHLYCDSIQGSHKNLKTEFHDFSMTDLLLSMTPILTQFQIWLWLCLTTCTTIKLESCHRHENKQFHDFSMISSYFPWLFGKFFIFQDLPMTFHDSNFFQDFPWSWEPWVLLLGKPCRNEPLLYSVSAGVQNEGKFLIDSKFGDYNLRTEYVTLLKVPITKLCPRHARSLQCYLNQLSLQEAVCATGWSVCGIHISGFVTVQVAISLWTEEDECI